MPLFFIHGVNVRKTDKDYKKEVARRNKLFTDVVLKPLKVRGSRFEKLAIHDIYWGDLGVTFGWKLASVPKVKITQAFGPAGNTVPPDEVIADQLETMAADSVLEGRSSPNQSMLKQAAIKDPVQFGETLLLPLLLSDFELREGSSGEAEGELEAVLAQATYAVCSEPAIQDQMVSAVTDEELIRILTAAVEKQLRADASPPGSEAAPVEAYGPNWIDQLRPRIGELFGRALSLPGRTVSVPALQVFRQGFHRSFSRFLGDVFVYLQKRGDSNNPGKIVQLVISELKAHPKQDPDEPVIVVTHSMGGNILYDVLTAFSPVQYPELFIDVWISAGGQVAQFEEMKLFLASDPNVGSPSHVTGLKQRVGYWLNVYDPADSFSFKAAPVFEDVDADLNFSTGAGAFKSHGEYFGLASLHRHMLEHIEKGLKLS